MVNWNTDYCKIIKAIEWRFYQSLSIYILMINLMSKSKNNIFGSIYSLEWDKDTVSFTDGYPVIWDVLELRKLRHIHRLHIHHAVSTLSYPTIRHYKILIFLKYNFIEMIEKYFFEQMRRTLHQLAWSISLYDRKASKLKHNSKYFSVCVCNSCKE